MPGKNHVEEPHDEGDAAMTPAAQSPLPCPYTSAELLQLVYDLTVQACSVQPDDRGFDLDDMSMSVYEEAFDVLEACGRIVTSPMRMARTVPAEQWPAVRFVATPPPAGSEAAKGDG